MPGRIQPAVTVESAEERYLDSNDRWPRDGSRVTITTDAARKALDLRFETNGSGSFVTTLTRQPKTPLATTRTRGAP